MAVFLRISCCAKKYDDNRCERYCVTGNRENFENGRAYMETIYDRLIGTGL